MSIMEKMDAMVGVLECLPVTRHGLEPGFVESAITQYLLSQDYSPEEIKDLWWEWKVRADENYLANYAREYEAQHPQHDYHPAEGEAHFYTNDAGDRPCTKTESSIPAEAEELDEGEGPCFECGEIINYREDAPCWNCNTI